MQYFLATAAIIFAGFTVMFGAVAQNSQQDAGSAFIAVAIALTCAGMTVWASYAWGTLR